MYRGKLVFATNNEHKLEEARHILSDSIKLLSLKDINFYDELPETHNTLEENAREKADHIYTNYQVNCFSEDSGLEVEALNGEPGVYSARYAGDSRNSDENILFLLGKMKFIKHRKARFRAIVALILDGNPILFEGIISGQILSEPVGSSGFGYDPVFMPEGYSKSFAQMNLDEKSKISHRKIALGKLAEFLNSVSNTK